jgi:hypothetical protein
MAAGVQAPAPDQAQTAPTLSQLFTRAAELCAKGWCQGEPPFDARDADGGPAHPLLEAVAWGATGALIRAGQELNYYGLSPVGQAISRLHTVLGEPVEAWNNASGRTQDEVVRFLSVAAEVARV